MVIPYIKGLEKKFKRICNKQGIQVHFKGTNTVKQLLMAPKDEDPKLTKVVSYTGINAPASTAQNNTQENLEEP